MNKQNANKMVSKKPLPKMRSLTNTATHLVFAGAGSERCVTGPACGCNWASRMYKTQL